MLKVYECYPMICIKDTWEEASTFPTTRLLDIPDSTPFYYDTFEELWNSNCVWINKEYSAFTGKGICYISTFERDLRLKITEKNFKKYGHFGYCWKYKEIKHPTMDYLFRNLPADDLIKYLKEREISFENLLTNR